MTLLQTIILAIVEGITEFLPISSTGHMILVSSLMRIKETDFVKFFEVAIQLGAILSVIILYWRRFLQTTQFYFKLFFAFIPAAVFGLLLHKKIDALFENPIGVAMALIVGGIVLIFIDRYVNDDEENPKTTPSFKDSFIIGLFQVVSLFPGVSRSAATIIGGLSQKLTRKAAAEFSFFLAVPTMFAATAFKMYEYLFKKDAVTHIRLHPSLTHDDLMTLLIGNVIAFVVAMIVIRFFITYLSKHGFRVFGIYRVIVGLLFIALYVAKVLV